MPRTRNFVLFLIGGFLVIAGMGIYAAPDVHLRSGSSVATAIVPLLDGKEITYGADVPPTTDDRAARLADLKAKLAEQTIIAAPDTPLEATTSVTEPVKSVATSTVPKMTEVQKCSGYTPASVSWPAHQIVMHEQEGVRFYTQTVPDATGSSTSEVLRVRIAERTWPLGSSSCLPTDVVGIATDGSLIRNGDLALYKVFSGTTEIGYSLDGYPIYGVTPDVETDSCGGAMVAGAYRYVIDSKRGAIITCFSGIPAMVQ
jgi:hypothetical protein